MGVEAGGVSEGPLHFCSKLFSIPEGRASEWFSHLCCDYMGASGATSPAAAPTPVGGDGARYPPARPAGNTKELREVGRTQLWRHYPGQVEPKPAPTWQDRIIQTLPVSEPRAFI